MQVAFFALLFLDVLTAWVAFWCLCFASKLSRERDALREELAEMREKSVE